MNESDRTEVKDLILEEVVHWTDGIIYEVFEMADNSDPKITWDDPEAMADYLCGLLSLRIKSHAQAQIQALLEDASETGP